jgi:hypothetical protein
MSEPEKLWRRPRKDAAAKVRFRIKGEVGGPIYQGQRIVVPCKTCGGKPKLDIATPDGTPAA